MATITLEFDDVAYENFAKEVGKENIFHVFKDFVENYPLYQNKPTHGMADYRLGDVTPFHMTDDLDKPEVTNVDDNPYKVADKSDTKETSQPIEMQIMPKENRPYRLGALPNIKVPDNFDKIEVTDFDV